MRKGISFFAALLLLALANISASAQWQNGNLAIKTNGSSFRSGDQLKVEIIALETIPEAFYTQVSYSYNIKVMRHIVEEKDGNKTERDEEVEETTTRKRKEGPILLNIEKHQSQLLDDSWHFGEGVMGRCITVTVDIFRAYTKERVGSLSSCVCYQESLMPGCRTFLRSFKKFHSNTWISFDGIFSVDARYSVLLLDEGKVVQFLNTGIYANEGKELNVSVTEFNVDATKNYDVLVHDHLTGNSSTLAKVIIPISK